MAIIYLSSVDGAAGDTDSGLTWALAKATLAGALTAAGAGGTVYVDNAHAETQASLMTLSSSGTAASPVNVICVDRTGNPEPPTTPATTATVSTTGANDIQFTTGFTIYDGITFSAGDGANTADVEVAFSVAAGSRVILKNCTLKLNNTSTSSRIRIGGTNASKANWNNVAVLFGSTSQAIDTRGELNWTGGSAAASGTVPNDLFIIASTVDANIVGVDLSTFGSGKDLVQGLDLSQVVLKCRFVNCKLGSSVSLAGGRSTAPLLQFAELVNSDSADTNYRYHFYDYSGDVTSETTIVRTGGASDGTTGLSHKFVTTANPEREFPLCGPWINLWNETTGSSVTITAEIVTDNVTLTNAEAWIEVDYLGTSGFPITTRVDDRSASILATPANQTSSSETWTTTGLGTPVKQALAVTFTPQEKGVIRARVCLAKASTTMYACPFMEKT